MADSAALAQGNPAPVATAATSSADPTTLWNGLGNPTFDPGKSLTVKNLTLQRDRIHLILDEGTVQFVQPVNGIVFGAVFHGKGRLQVSAPNAIEKQQLRYFTNQEDLNLAFDQAVLSFSDNTFAEITAQGQPASSGDSSNSLYVSRQQERENNGANFAARLFKGLVSGDRDKTALFLADVNAQGAGWVEAKYDALEPEQITVAHWSTRADSGKQYDIWTSFPAGDRSASDAFKDPLEKADFTVHSYEIDATATAAAEFSAVAKVHFEPRWGGEHVLVFDLDPNLRLDKVLNSQGQALTFFQARERKDLDTSNGSYVVVALPEAAAAASQQTLEFHYAGKRVIKKVGSGSYFCESFGWYPVRMRGPLTGGDFDTRKDFDMTFHSPKKYTLVATGQKLQESSDGNTTTTKWKSEAPQTVAGFAFGDFKVYPEKANKVDVEIMANREPDDVMSSILQHTGQEGSSRDLGDPNVGTASVPLGTLSPAAMAKGMAQETANTIRLFELYFGPYPFSKIVVTNIPGDYGQGWPGLVYLSTISFMDTTQLNTFGIHDISGVTDFFRGHESSHQWWGHKVSWKSYHDQWLSEGFAQFSGNLYVDFRESRKEYLNRLHLDTNELLTADRRNHTLESVAPVWMGRRVESSYAPGAYQPIVYNKGGYVLHMLRMMMQDTTIKTPDAPFAIMMQDFTHTFDGKAASTEDFQAVVERHMNADMDVDGNHRMDWFFRQYVYGTGIPHYDFHYTLQPQADKSVILSVTMNRTNVPDNWKDVIPIYAQVGKESRLIGRIIAQEPTTTFQTMLPFVPQKISINDNLDTLADVKQ